MLVDVRPAREAIPALAGRTILHAGPPIEWARMCGPMQGAVIGAILFEGWATSAEVARGIIDSGAITFAPCHHHGAVGPMAGIVSPSMPVVVVENASAGNRAFATLNEGLGKVLRFGAYDAPVLDRLRWMAQTARPRAGPRARSGSGPSTSSASRRRRSRWATSATTGTWPRRRSSPGPSPRRWPARSTAPRHRRVLDFLLANDHFFLNLSMAACKAALDAAHGIDGSTVVTAMARNGVEFGIRVSGTGARGSRIRPR